MRDKKQPKSFISHFSPILYAFKFKLLSSFCPSKRRKLLIPQKDVSESHITNFVTHKRGRLRKDISVEALVELKNQGMGAKKTASILQLLDVDVSYKTIRRRLKENSQDHPNSRTL